MCQKASDSSPSYIVANIYAPNPNNAAKIDFFDSLFETVAGLVERFDCSNVIMAGDYNLILAASEAKNRQYSAQEKRVAEFVKEQMGVWQLKDSWEDGPAFTWRRPNSTIFSTIDRILYSSETMELSGIKEDWSYGFSDHAAIIASFKIKSKVQLQKSKITRLDPSLAKSSHYKELIIQGYNSLIETIPEDWNPHLKLEFAKMSIRTVAERIQAERKRVEYGEEKNIDEELDTAINKLSRGEVTMSKTSLTTLRSSELVSKLLLTKKEQD